MPRVVVNHAVPPARGDLVLNVNERPATFMLKAPTVPSDVIYQMKPRTFDLLLIAESVFAADSLNGRGGPSRPEFGANWVRDFRFVVPVSDAEFWSSIHDTLTGVLKFLTGDDFEFEFVERFPKLPRQKGLGLGYNIQVDQVVLLSGGLDSLTGAMEVLSGSTDGRLLLVTHCSASMTMAIQRQIVTDLEALFPRRVTWVPVTGRLSRIKARETTQRSRSFLYGALGFAAAMLVDLSRFSLYENGIVSLNLPISRQIVGTMATRTTHPLFLSRFGDLLSKLAERSFAIDNPYAWLTKTEVVSRLRNLGGAHLIGKTTSCSSVRHRTRPKPLCGSCSQCIDRRVAVLASNGAKFDPSERYEVNLFLDAPSRPQDRTMVLDWVRRAVRLGDLKPLDFAEAFGAELADVAAAYSDRPRGQVYADAFQMHRRHGATVQRVVTRALGELAGKIVEGTVPSGSLLASLALSSVIPTSEVCDIETSAEDAPLLEVERSIFPLRLIFDPEAGPKLRIKGLGDFRGAHLTLVGNLRQFLEEDVEAQLLAHEHRWIHPGAIGKKGTVRQHAKRCRDEFAAQYEVVEGVRPDPDILIRSRKPKGYQLDPEARFVED